MSTTEQALRAELSQTQVQLHQVNMAVQHQLAAFDAALRTIEETFTHLAETNALADDIAEEQRAALVAVRGALASTGTFLHWRLRAVPHAR